MKWTRFFLLILIVLSLGLSACQDDDASSDSDDGSDITSGDAGADADPGDPAPTLGAAAPGWEVYMTQGGLVMSYPQGWVVQEADMSLVVANSQAALDAALDGGRPDAGMAVLLVLDPLGTAMVNQGGSFTVQETLPIVAAAQDDQGNAMTVSEVEDVTVGGKPGYRVETSGDNAEGFGLAVELAGDRDVIMLAFTASGELAQFEADLMGIAETVGFSGTLPKDE